MGAGGRIAVIRGIAFDLDGTFYPNWIMYLRSAPFVLRHRRLVVQFNRVRRAIRRGNSLPDLHRAQAEMLAPRLRVGVIGARRLLDRYIYGEWEALLRSLPLYPGLRRLLRRLRETGIKLAVLSDFPIGSKLKILGIDRGWHCTLSSEQTGLLKPHPEPFRHICRMLSLPPHQVLYVGNSYAYDVIGASRAGLQVAHLTKRRRAGCVADFSFHDFRQLERWLASRMPPVFAAM